MLLCIDDEPIRYIRLANHLREINSRTVVAVTCKIDEVNFYLKTADVIGVCLDHDMPVRGTSFAQHFFTERNIPVMIVSHNPGGALKIMDILNEFGTPNIYCPVKDTKSWLDSVIRFFNLEGANDLPSRTSSD